MDFKTAFENYNTGCASSEERCLVERELEKYLLIAEHFDARIAVYHFIILRGD